MEEQEILEAEEINALNQWRKEGKHLPEFMRDFHDQKELFKALHRAIDRENKDPSSNQKIYFEGLTWMNCHVYTIDIFLWIMAAHGYTLQKSRANQSFGNIDEYLNRARESRLEQSANALRQVLDKNKNS